MIRLLMMVVLLVLCTSRAWAVCGVSSVQVKDNTGATANYTAVNDGTNCAGETALVAGGAIVAAGNGLPVTSASGATFAVTQGTAANLLATVSQGGTWNITNVSGTVSLPTGASTAALQPTNAAQASTTSGQTGTLVQGAVTTAPPSYTNGQTDPLSLTTGGALRSDVSSFGGTAALALSDALGNPTTVELGSNLLGWDVTNTVWRRVQVDTGTGTLKVDPGTVTVTGTVAATQSGTWNITNVSGTVSLPTGASTSANQPTNAAQASTTSGQTGNLIQGAVTTGAPTYVTAQTDPLSLTTGGALRSDMTTIAGNAPKTGSGNGSSTGSLNVYLATDQPSLTNPLSFNLTQINGNATLTGNGTTGTGSPRVTLSSDNSAVSGLGAGATGSAVPANAVYHGGNGSGNLTGITVCDNWTSITNGGASTALKIITKTAAKQTYICSINLVASAANNVALVEGTLTTTNCDTATAGLAGGTTAATGWNFAANGGIAFGSGLGAVLRTATVNHDVCLFFSAANQVSGSVSWTQY